MNSMNSKTNAQLTALLACAVSFAATAQQPAPSAVSAVPAAGGAAPAPTPNIDVRMIRLKLSAGDLPSAESILETHRAEKGQDGDYTLGVAWLARGAALLGDWKAASAYAKEARQIAEAKLHSPADYESQGEAVYALGTAIEVEAQVLAAAGKKREALRLLDASERAQEAAHAPFNLRARIWKCRNKLELAGRKAPAFRLDDHLGGKPPTLESLRGKPAVLFFWWESCGDCKMQAAALRKVVEKYSPKGVAFVALTRFYENPEARATEKDRIQRAWTDIYGLADKVPVLISDEAMLRYGVSATPTFALLDSAGIVRLYSPTRLTEERLSAGIEKLLP